MRPQAGAESHHEELSGLFGMCGKVLAKSGDPRAFLDWIAEHGPGFAPQLARGVDQRAGPLEHAFRAIGVAIFGAMPLPEAGFRPRRLPEPGRNDPCLCGSGRKYKHCCLELRGMLDLSGYNMLRHLLDSLPKARFAELAASRVDPMAVWDTARQWREEGDEERAAALLEPWFAGDAPLRGALEPLFDELMDCYLVLGREGKRARLVAAALERGDRELRSAALQRRATILADRGDAEGAWKSFAQAQREDPQNESLAMLELTLLVSSGRIEQARERARFWVGRLERRGDPAHEDLLAFLRKAQADPQAAMAQMDSKRFPALERLTALARAAPPPQVHYRLADRGEAGRVLEPQEALRKLEARWRKLFPQTKPDLTATQHDFTGMWDAPEGWLDFLEREALAWQSFDVLDDLAMAVEALRTMATDATLLEPLLERGVALLEASLAAAPGSTLQWGWAENRPALRLAAHLACRAVAAMDRGASGERVVALGERLIALNPNDNHFMREPLTRAYLAAGAPEKALALAERYPDDFCGPTLNRILALVHLGRRGDALVALRGAAREHRAAIEMLLAEAPKRPRPDPGFGVVAGGRQEAWEYREAHRALWARAGALEWLREAWRAASRDA